MINLATICQILDGALEDATDEDLTAPGLLDRLEARLPALMADFRAAVESLGFVY